MTDQVYSNRSTINLKNTSKQYERNQAQGDTMIYPVIQLAAKACLLHVVEVCHKRLGLATKTCFFLVIKSREQTIEVGGNFLAST
jgi:hypothetical protein